MLNYVAIIGRMVRDPELRHTEEGTPVGSFSLAVEQDIPDKYGGRDVDYIDCVAWRSTAEFVRRNFTKGQMACVTGRLRQRRWLDKDSGGIRAKLEVVADNVYFTGSKPAAPGPAEPQKSHPGLTRPCQCGAAPGKNTAEYYDDEYEDEPI